jgi:hypothetical protein
MQNELTAEQVKVANEYLNQQIFTASMFATSEECKKHNAAVKTAIAALREVQERQKGCVYCTDFEDLPEHIINGKSVGKVFDTSITCDENGRWHIELPSGNDIGISVCPYCGRRLTEGSAE